MPRRQDDDYVVPLPSFFVIGAPKSGTTAFYRALARHPEVFLPAVKEPAYFAFSGRAPRFAGPRGAPSRRIVSDPREYLALYAGANTELAIGDATTAYLGSAVAAEAIRRNVPQARLVVLLRDPVQRAYSSYWSWVAAGAEPAPSFEAALAEEATGARANWWPGLSHRAGGLYYARLGHYVRLFGRAQVQVHLYEDWRGRPEETLRRTFSFLGVDDGFNPGLGESNVTRAVRVRWAHHVAHRMPVPGIAAVDRVLNTVAPPPMRTDTRERLRAEYGQDVERLQGLIQRDLSQWLAR